MQKQIFIIGIYAINSVVFQCIQTGSYVIAKVHPNPIGNFYVLIETIILLWFFASAFNKLTFVRVMLLVGVLYTIIFVCFALPDLYTIHSSTRAVRDLVMIICSSLYFFLLLKNLPGEDLYTLPMFWISAAILFFFSCTFILSLSTTYLIKTFRDQYVYFASFRNLLRALFCLIICLGIWKSQPFGNIKAGNSH
ncbi:hypothetical protein [Chryseotalea sanaruensis]|uniref:hypothetical protein n=1 Tax=Chryseotalea sanaruensis TaxID=2482724 RepID=UPI000F8C9AF8|nr:hypothetical protein [Chryseotalea sanaruensis]